MIRAFIVEQNQLICNIISAFLEKQADMVVVGWATTPEAALEQIGGCDIVLLDGKLPNPRKFTLIRLLAKIAPQVKVVVLNLEPSERVILQHLEAGAAGYVPKDASVEMLLRTIRATHCGESLVSPRLTTMLIARVAELKQLLTKQGVYPNVLPALTEREREVLDLVKLGLGNREISKRLVIEVGTVKNHIHNILRKYKVNSRREIPSLVEKEEEIHLDFKRTVSSEV
ncbi:MAG: response regulator transcription factor [Anaerolineae bacterium]|nr:response regulator transcription factor [Anaerolineae bacterium]